MSRKKATELLKSVAAKAETIEKKFQPVEQPEDNAEVSKALQAHTVAPFARAARLHGYSAGAAKEGGMGTQRTRSAYEPPVIPVRRVVPPNSEVVKAEELTDCTTCGIVHKSTSGCPRCKKNTAEASEALPFHKRGR